MLVKLKWYAMQTFNFLSVCLFFMARPERNMKNSIERSLLLEKGSNLCTKFVASIAEMFSLFEDGSVQKSFQGNNILY
jgi:hypothetical protein